MTATPAADLAADPIDRAGPPGQCPSTPSEPPRSVWLKVADAAHYAALGVDTIYTACERGELRHVRVGGRRAIRLRAEWIDEWLERHATLPRSIGVLP
jgi:excisionase family DNA binding protein